MKPAFDIRYVTDLDPHVVNTRIIHNPRYGGASVNVPGCCTIKLRRGVKPQTRQEIQDDIAKNGFRNPIVVYSTDTGIHLSFGGGRLFAAKNLDIVMPAIVVDYSGDYAAEKIVTPQNCRDFFLDPPKTLKFTDVGIFTHYGLERTRHDDDFDEAGMEWTKSLDDDSFIYEESPWLQE